MLFTETQFCQSYSNHQATTLLQFFSCMMEITPEYTTEDLFTQNIKIIQLEKKISLKVSCVKEPIVQAAKS